MSVQAYKYGTEIIISNCANHTRLDRLLVNETTSLYQSLFLLMKIIPTVCGRIDH